MSRLVLILAPLAVFAPPASAAAAPWHAPVPGRVVGAFTYDRTTPFARGQRRGIDLAAPPGATVVSPCAGRVVFAGRVPGRGGAVSVRCGALTATVLGLATVPRVARGAVVIPGATLGITRSTGVIRLGARRPADRFGYVDPSPLLGRSTQPPELLARRRVGPPAAPRPASLPRPAAVPAVAPPRAAPVTPGVAAWLGGGLVAVALGAGVTRRHARRRVASATPCPSTSPRPSTT
jgi:hypothetical protein